MTFVADPPKSRTTGSAVRTLRTALSQLPAFESLATLSTEELLKQFKKDLDLRDPEQLARELDSLSLSIKYAASAVQARQSEQLLRNAKERAIHVRKELFERGLVMSSSKFTEALRFSRQALSKAVQERRVFALQVGNDNFYPAFYADPALERSKLYKVSKALGDCSGWEKWAFFTTRKLSLGKLTPLEALKKGRFADVARAAAGYADR